MPGFFVSDHQIQIGLQNARPDYCVQERLSLQGQTVARHTLKKFMADKAFCQDDDFVYVLDGVVLNKKALFEKYGADDMQSLLRNMYLASGETFFSELRGPFSGAFFDKMQKKWLVFTNHIGDHPIFYYLEEGFFCAGSQINYLLDACRAAGKKLTFDESAAYQMLTFAFMADDSTYAKQIKRLRGGTYLVVTDGKAEVKEYHIFRKDPRRFADKTDEELVEILDKGFRHAVELEYDKDREYGYRHLADLSGGLDSRMNVWVAHEVGNAHLQCITYCQANTMDERIAKEIAEHWGDELLVKPLNDVSFLYDIDRIVALNAGLSLYSGITGGLRMLESLNTDRYGMEHTGMVGDVVIGAWEVKKKRGKLVFPSGKYSEKLKDRLTEQVKTHHRNFQDDDLYLMYVRGFQGAANTHLIRQNFTEVASPFLNADFMQLCMDIPLERRRNHRLYKKWIISKYPQAAAYRWERTGAPVRTPRIVEILSKLMVKGPQKLLRMLGLAAMVKNCMDPFDHWLTVNEDLREYLDAYAETGFGRTGDAFPERLTEDMKNLYATGTAVEKTMVLTVLGSYKLYFGDEQERE